MENLIRYATTMALALMIGSILHKVVRAATSPLKALPGPFAARFTKFWYFRHVWDSSFPRLNLSLHRKYGKIVRIAPHEYSIDDPEAVKQILGTTIKWNKGPWYSGWGAPPTYTTWYRDLFSRRDPKDHAAAKKLVAPLYSMSKLTQMEDRIDETLDAFLAKLYTFASSRQEFNLQLWFQCYVTDAVFALTLDKRYGFIEHGDSAGLLETFHMSNKMQTRGGVYPNAIWLFMGLIGLLRLPSPFEDLERRIREKVKEIESGRSEDNTGFIHGFLDVHAKHPADFPMGGLETSCIVNLSAGSDTTSISLSMILFHLMKSPDSMQKLREEIESNHFTGHITFQQAQKLPYLQAVISEGIRLHPATGLPMPRMVPEEGATIAGQFFPAGTIVGINSWVAHHNAEVFGPDAEKFRPERWLEKKDDEGLRNMDNYFLGFGGGARSCIGKNISMLEMYKVIPELVTKFDFELADPQMKVQTDGCWFVKPTNIMVKISRRK